MAGARWSNGTRLVVLSVVLGLLCGVAGPGDPGATWASNTVDDEDAAVVGPELQQVPPAPAQIPAARPTTTNPTAAMGQIMGTVTYREKIALPPNAVVEVRLEEVSRADASATVLGEQKIETKGQQAPIRFEIQYDPSQVDERLLYAVRARITVDGQLWFISTPAPLVLTRNDPRTNVEVEVRRV